MTQAPTASPPAPSAPTPSRLPLSPARANLAAYVALARGKGRTFLNGYRKRRRAAHLPRTTRHPQRVLDEAARVLAHHSHFTRRDVQALIGGPTSAISEAYRTLQRRCDQLPHTLPENDIPPDTLGPWLVSMLGDLPETCLDPELGADIPAPPWRLAARVNRLSVPALRLGAGLALLLKAAAGHVYLSMRVNVSSFEELDKLLAAGDALDHTWRMQTFQTFITDESLSPSYRYEIWAAWRAALNTIDAYARNYPTVAGRYAPWRLGMPGPLCKRAVADVKRRALQAASDKRTQTCTPVTQDPQAIREAYANRYTEIAMIRREFDSICAALRRSEIALRRGMHRFSLTLPRTTPYGLVTEGTSTLDFRVTALDALARRTGSSALASLAKQYDKRLFLEYCGTREGNELPLLTFYRIGAFAAASHRTAHQEAECARLLPAPRWSRDCASYGLFHPRDWVGSRIANIALEHGITLIPISELHHAVAVGRAIGLCVLRGARLGEVLQQVPDTFQTINGAQGTGYAYQAIAKKQFHPSLFVLLPTDFEAVVEVAQVMKLNGWVPITLCPAAHLKEKCPPARYLYQRNGYIIGCPAATAAVGLPLWPHSLRAHDLRHGLARNLAHHGQTLSTIGKVLHHASASTASSPPEPYPSQTRLYCAPSPEMQVDLLYRLDAAHDATRDATKGNTS